jgi:serine/threonine-protein kinase ULK/ATG1
VLEYCAGGDLSEFIKRRGRVTEAVARNFMVQLAAGLRAMRAQNLIHRDLKPQNLLLTTPNPVPPGGDTTGDGDGDGDGDRDGNEGGGGGRDAETMSPPTAATADAGAGGGATLKIADFGFARYMHPTGMAETLCGSPLYMAPEILSYQKYDAKAGSGA